MPIQRYKPEQIVYGRSIRALDAAKIADGLFVGTVRRGQSDSRQRHRPSGSGARCDELGDPRCTRTIGNASRLSLRLHDRAGDKLQRQASIVVVWHASPSKRHLDVFKQLLPLELRKANYQTR
jgi:hypothetical protein